MHIMIKLSVSVLMNDVLKDSFSDFLCYIENVLFRIVVLFILRNSIIKFLKVTFIEQKLSFYRQINC